MIVVLFVYHEIQLIVSTNSGVIFILHSAFSSSFPSVLSTVLYQSLLGSTLILHSGPDDNFLFKESNDN